MTDKKGPREIQQLTHSSLVMMAACPVCAFGVEGVFFPSVFVHRIVIAKSPVAVIFLATTVPGSVLSSMTSIVKKNVVTEGSEAIKVFVRVRPELQRERESAESDDHAVTFVAKDELRVKSRVRDATCKFDRVFPPQTTQVDVYNAVKD